MATDDLPIHSFIKADYRFVAPPCQLEGRREKPGFQRLTTHQDGRLEADTLFSKLGLIAQFFTVNFALRDLTAANKAPATFKQEEREESAEND